MMPQFSASAASSSSPLTSLHSLSSPATSRTSSSPDFPLSSTSQPLTPLRRRFLIEVQPRSAPPRRSSENLEKHGNRGRVQAKGTPAKGGKDGKDRDEVRLEIGRNGFYFSIELSRNNIVKRRDDRGMGVGCEKSGEKKVASVTRRGNARGKAGTLTIKASMLGPSDEMEEALRTPVQNIKRRAVAASPSRCTARDRKDVNSSGAVRRGFLKAGSKKARSGEVLAPVHSCDEASRPSAPVTRAERKDVNNGGTARHEFLRAGAKKARSGMASVQPGPCTKASKPVTQVTCIEEKYSSNGLSGSKQDVPREKVSQTTLCTPRNMNPDDEHEKPLTVASPCEERGRLNGAFTIAGSHHTASSARVIGTRPRVRIGMQEELSRIEEALSLSSGKQCAFRERV